MANKTNKFWETIMETEWQTVEITYNKHIASPTYDSLKEYYECCARYCSVLREYKCEI